MKIAFLYSSFFRHGGIQRVTALVANELAKNHQVTLICTEEFQIENNFYNIDLQRIQVVYSDVFQINNRNNYYIDRIKRIALKYNMISYKKSKDIYFGKRTKTEMVDLIKNYEFDIIIGCSMIFNLLLGSIKSSVPSRLIGWEHNSYDSYFKGYNRKNNYPKICVNLLSDLDDLIVLTKHDQKKFKRNLGIDTKLIPNPLSFKSKMITNQNNKKILIVGRLEKTKGTDLLIEIIKKFCFINSEWNFKIIGEGPLENQLKDSISDNNLNKRVEIAKFTNEISSEYEASDIYINTSRYESFGLTVLEAMQHGLPVITFDTAGPGELVETNFSGHVIDKYNIDDFVEKLNFLCTNNEIRNEMAENAIIRSQDFTIEEIMMKWNELLVNCKAKGNL